MILGVDPGNTGALAWLDDVGQPVSIQPMPVFKLEGKTHLNIGEVIKIFTAYKGKIVLEQQQPFPGQGVVSVGTLMKGYGILLGVAGALNIPCVEVLPRLWKKEMFKGVKLGRKKEQLKEASRRLCQQLWPAVGFKLDPEDDEMDHGLCEAALLAEYGRRVIWRS